MNCHLPQFQNCYTHVAQISKEKNGPEFGSIVVIVLNRAVPWDPKAQKASESFDNSETT